ncbi:hypothetical protein [Paraburkholderia saeva]|uniref:hypothetical protein n=1 Tax=Paraburkholderia saeva TaxID=2777537 RepID=UPI001E64BFC4|nr:hypothetical protein [Paraburkholderia saeva]
MKLAKSASRPFQFFRISIEEESLSAMRTQWHAWRVARQTRPSRFQYHMQSNVAAALFAMHEWFEPSG